MVNINQINELAHTVGGHTQAKSTAGAGSLGFDSVLSSALEKTESAEGDTQAMGLGEISAPGIELTPLSSIVTGKTDQLLGMLDTYASQLMDPGISLKKIQPVLEQINADASALSEETQLLGEEDKALKEIATHTVVTAKTEYLKFQRGDYLT